MKGNTLISLVGLQGSGKSTLGHKIARRIGTEKIETSDVVRSIYKNLKRSELPTTAERTKDDPDWLGRAVFDTLEGAYADSGKRAVVLTGVRELEVQKFLKKMGLNIYSFEVVCDAEIRYQRLLSLGKVIDAREFLRQELAERGLGVLDIMDAAPFTIPTSHETDPDRISKAVVRELNNRDVPLR